MPTAAKGIDVMQQNTRTPRLSLIFFSSLSWLLVAGALPARSEAPAESAAAAASARYHDNGDGTVLDRSTGLVWEKKVDGAGCLHCVGDQYDWNDAMSDWLAELNGPTKTMGPKTPGLAGHSDWRLPTVDELAGITDCTAGPSCLDTTFGPNDADGYWTGSVGVPDPPLPAFAWGVDFATGSEGLARKSARGRVRAVRGVAKTD